MHALQRPHTAPRAVTGDCNPSPGDNTPTHDHGNAATPRGPTDERAGLEPAGRVSVTLYPRRYQQVGISIDMCRCSRICIIGICIRIHNLLGGMEAGRGKLGP